jgi:hypothetical protein
MDFIVTVGFLTVIIFIKRRAAYGHNLFQEAQNQQGRNHRTVLERAV